VPSDLRAQVNPVPATSETTPLRLGTVTGKEDDVVPDPTPSCPVAFDPQHWTDPVASNAQL